MRSFNRIISVIFSIAIVASFGSAPAFALGESGSSKANYWQAVSSNSSFLRAVLGAVVDGVCPSAQSPDGKHHGRVHGFGGNTRQAHAVCDYCGAGFTIADFDAPAAYQEHVEEMPVNGVTNTGSFVWYPTCRDILFEEAVGNFSGVGIEFENGFGSAWSPPCFFNEECFFSNYLDFVLSGSDRAIVFDGYPRSSYGYISAIMAPHFRFRLVVPVSGSYYRVSSPRDDFSFVCTDGVVRAWSDSYSDASGVFMGKDEVITVENRPKTGGVLENNPSVTRIHGLLNLPQYTVIPDVSALTGHENDYTSDSRPASISGKYIVENGDAYEDSSTVIVNEDDNSVYNPVTNTTTTYDDWTYDYSSRTYTFDNSAGDTTTVTYGDENITIKEGDTVYNINYYITPEGGEDPAPTPTPDPGHTHNYTGTITREPSCTLKGVKTYTCECGDSYTESIAALGHDWVIKEQVATAYGDNGEIVTQGYTVYRCTRCGEEYKSTDGTAPASGGGDSSSLWSKIGELLGTIFGGLFKLIGQFLISVLDVLISLAQEIGDKLAKIIEMILGWFDELPKLFAGFLGFLQAVFPFIPAEAMMLLTFGMAAVVFIGIIKALRRR